MILGSQLTGDSHQYIANVGRHYLPPGPQLISQPQIITALWPLPNYSSW